MGTGRDPAEPLWVRRPHSSYPALAQHSVGQEGMSPGVLVDTHPECPGATKTFLGSRSDLKDFHTAQPKKAFVLHQEMQPVRGCASRTEGSRPPADAD